MVTVVSTTTTAKQIWAAAARATGEEGAKLAEEIEKEKNWRFGYVKHLVKMGELLAGPKGQLMAKSGLDKLYEVFSLGKVGLGEASAGVVSAIG